MDNQPTKRQKRFLVEWTILNLLGWVIGVYLVFLVATNWDTLKHSAWKYGLANDFRKEWTVEAALVWLPLGISVGISQWLKLRRFRVNLFVWIFVTVLGCSILVTLYAWILNFDSFEYSEYNIPDWLINTGLVITLPIFRRESHRSVPPTIPPELTGSILKPKARASRNWVNLPPL